MQQFGTISVESRIVYSEVSRAIGKVYVKRILRRSGILVVTGYGCIVGILCVSDAVGDWHVRNIQIERIGDISDP